MWIGVDLDGTLAKIMDWIGPESIGEPIMPMVERVKSWVAEGIEVRIFTARVDGGVGLKAMGIPLWELYTDVDYVKQCIEDWCIKNLGFILPITNQKDMCMLELWDDRAVQLIPDTGETLALFATSMNHEINSERMSLRCY